MRLPGIWLIAAVCATATNAFAQQPSLVFTAPTPTREDTAVTFRAFPVIEERGLALWGGAASDFGIGVDVGAGRWTVRTIASLTMLPIGRDSRPMYQQVEALRPVLAKSATSVIAGGGIRQEWDGTQVLIGRALVGANLAAGRLEGSVVLERANSSMIRRDAADMVTSLGWARHVGDRIALGVEGIGQDLEGFWDPSEADGGAKLLVGPSIRVQSKRGNWAAAATAGPVIRSPAVVPDGSGRIDRVGGRHYGFFASGSWLPSRR